MPIATILAVLAGEPSDASVLESASVVAGRTGARVRALFVCRDPADVLLLASPDGLVVSRQTIDFAEEEFAQARSRARGAFEASRVGRGGEVRAELIERPGRLDQVVAAEGQVADLVLVASPRWGGRQDSVEALEAVLFRSGRPVLVVPKRVAADLASHALIAWKATPEAARAVSAALPLLSLAERVEIFAAEDATGRPADASALAEFLAAHGIAAHPLGFDGGGPVGAALLKEVERHRATLLVLGGYGHGRLRELVFGGVTQHVLDHATVPLLIMH